MRKYNQFNNCQTIKTDDLINKKTIKDNRCGDRWLTNDSQR